MVNTDGVEVLVFDLDGNLFQSDKVTFDSINWALSQIADVVIDNLNWEQPILRTRTS